MRSWQCETPEETQQLGVRLGQALFPGALILLEGDLGAGKTCLAQGIAQGLGIRGPVQSPTFVLVQEYPEARIPLRHADVYRLRREEELWALGIEERLKEGVWVVEWASIFPDFWPEDHLKIQLEDTGTGRHIHFTAMGPRHQGLEDV